MHKKESACTYSSGHKQVNLHHQQNHKKRSLTFNQVNIFFLLLQLHKQKCRAIEVNWSMS